MEQLFSKWLELLERISSDTRLLGLVIGGLIAFVLLVSGQWIIIVVALVLFYILKRTDPDIFGTDGEYQKKLSWDLITKNRIVKGALIALSGSAAIGLLEFFGTVEISNPMLAQIVAWACPFFINSTREWMKGL